MSEKETNLARDRWRRAEALGSTNSYIYLQLAKDVVRQILVGVSLNYRVPEKQCAQLRGWLDQVLKLNPDYWEAYETLAVVEAFAEKLRSSVINNIQEALKLIPDSPRTLVSLAVIRWRIKDLSTSEMILDGVEKRPGLETSIKALAGNLRKRIAADREKQAATERRLLNDPTSATDAGSEK